MAFILVGTQAAADVTLSIRFFDKRIYFPGSEIPLMITISNESDATYRFKVADDRVYSLSFEARTPSNRLLDLSDGYKVAMSQSKPVFYRELAIKPGEEYSFREALDRFVRVDTPGVYTIKAMFFPELVSSAAAAPISSNVLSLSVRPSPGLPPASEAIRAVTGEAIKAQACRPMRSSAERSWRGRRTSGTIFSFTSISSPSSREIRIERRNTTPSRTRVADE